MEKIAAYIYLIGILAYSVFAFLISIAIFAFLIYRGIKNLRSGKCFFHDLRIGSHLKYVAGAYWYHECPVCGTREATKMRIGESPLNQRWLNGGNWDHPLNPVSKPPEKVIWHRFLMRPIEFLKYTDWPYTPV
jgi:hypothetical protein